MSIHHLQLRPLTSPPVEDMSQTQIDAIRAAVVDAISRAEARDHEARGLAREALQAIQSHERLCAERTRQAEQHREAMKTKMERMEQMMWAMLCSIMVSLLGVLGTTFWPRIIH